MKEILMITQSKLKAQILKELVEKPLTPGLLSKVMKKPRPSISRALNDLIEYHLVKCDNPDDTKFRFYSITTKGKDALKEAKKYQ